MGQAKLRKSEIATLKAQSATLNIMAIRHLKNGQSEIFTFSIEQQSVPEPKSELLNYICTENWLHNPPVAAIAGYLLKTDTYKIIEQMGADIFGYAITFLEQDIDGSHTYSCHDTSPFASQECWDGFLNFTIKKNAAANDMDVKRRA